MLYQRAKQKSAVLPSIIVRKKPPARNIDWTDEIDRSNLLVVDFINERANLLTFFNGAFTVFGNSGRVLTWSLSERGTVTAASVSGCGCTWIDFPNQTRNGAGSRYPGRAVQKFANAQSSRAFVSFVLREEPLSYGVEEPPRSTAIKRVPFRDAVAAMLYPTSIM